MISIEYIHKLLDVYNQLCRPLCQQTGIPQTSLDILMFLKNNPQYKTAADIVKIRGIKANLVSLHVERLVQEGYLERREVQRTFIETLFSGISAESRKVFEQVMEQTEENLNTYQKENKKK